jgi:hypothetical protein
MEVLTQKVLLLIESMLQNAKQLQHTQFYCVVSSLKIVGHGNRDNNLESHSISKDLGYGKRQRKSFIPVLN